MEITPKIVRHLNAKVFHHFLFIVLLIKNEQRLLEKREKIKTDNSTPIRIPSRTFLTRHALTSRYCFTHFQKWKSSDWYQFDNHKKLTVNFEL